MGSSTSLESPGCKAEKNKFSFFEKLKQVYRYNLLVALPPDNALAGFAKMTDPVKDEIHSLSLKFNSKLCWVNCCKSLVMQLPVQSSDD